VFEVRQVAAGARRQLDGAEHADESLLVVPGSAQHVADAREFFGALDVECSVRHASRF
jgi:hypothetical protein